MLRACSICLLASWFPFAAVVMRELLPYDLATDVERYLSTGDVGLHSDALVENSLILRVVAHRDDTLGTCPHRALGAADGDATARGGGACDDERCIARVDKSELHLDLLTALG